MMTEKCYQLLLDLSEISGYIHNGQYDSYPMLEKLLRSESKLMMLLALAIKEDIKDRNRRFLIDFP
tara:strand:- start:471 stop:668 length:198 start_codon:yes stop_codon:yes gene_type:complete